MSASVQLTWPGKRPPERPAPGVPPAQVAEYRAPDACGAPLGRLVCGDNLATMAALLPDLAGRIDLIYLDPPFFSGSDWHTSELAVPSATRLAAFEDTWGGETGAYLQWLFDRLAIARDLLSPTGCIYLHLGWQTAHYGRLLMDELFGAACFQNEIAWCYREAINSRTRWNRKHDTLLYYSRGRTFTFHPEAVLQPYSESHIRKYRHRDNAGAYRIMGRGIEGSPLRSKRDLPPACEHEYPDLTYRHYLGTGTLPVDYWLIDIENQASLQRTGYPTQKPEALLERILLACTNPGDLVGDFCCGSGTTLAVAERLGRRWIGCDASPLAVHTTRKRLLQQGAAFALEQVSEGAAPSIDVPNVVAPCACPVALRECSGERVAELSAGAQSWVDMWALQWAPNGNGPFQPDWWEMRTRRTPDLSARSPAAPAYEAQGARIVLTTADGRDLTLDLAYVDPKREPSSP